jgi:tetratricopeptide (TPR) repeat protein
VEIARCVAAAEAALGSDDLARAQAALARLGELASDNEQLGPLRYRLEEMEARLAREAKLAQLAATVREHLGREDVEAAGRAIEEALGIDSEDLEIQALAERVQARRQEREGARRAALERRAAHAQARLAAGDLAGALAEFAALLAEDPNLEVAASGLAEARARQEANPAREAAIARQAALQGRVVEGRLRLAEGDPAGAIECFEAVLREDAEHAEAQRGLAEARQRREAIEAQVAAAARRAALEARVAAGRLRLSAGDVAGAIERFEAVLAEDASQAEARREHEESRGRLTAIAERAGAAARRATLDAQVAEAQRQLAAGDLVGPVERLEAVLRDDASHAGAQRALEDARARRNAREAELQEAGRRAALDAGVAEAQARLAAGDLAGAIQRFEAVLRDDGSHAEAQRGLGEARDRLAALEGREAEARAKLAAGDLTAAIHRFEAILRDDRAHAGARAGLAEAHKRQAAQLARETEISTALAVLEATLQEQDLEMVQAALAWLVDLAPEHPQLGALRQRITEHRERVEEDREQVAREALADAGRFIREGQVDRALEALARARTLAPQHPDLPKLERQAQRIAAGREDRLRGLLASAQSALDRDDVEGARRAVRDALGLDARHQEALAVQERVEARGRELTESRRADELAAEVGRLLEQGSLDDSVARLVELRGLAPGHRALGDLESRVEEARRAQAEKATALVSAVEAALGKDDLAAAGAAVAKLAELAPTHTRLAALRQRIQARRSDPQQIAREALEEAARLIRESRPERVAEVLERVRAVAPDHPQIAKIEAQAQKVLEAREARLRVRSLVDRARKLQVRSEFKEALALAEEAVKLAPDDAAALRLRDDLAEQARKEKRSK